ncbi:MAG: hypothetical protein Q8N23_34510 [Archangium sp.]|nr:hypothetical protein [Archangium sp.]MDP3157835.1 hypothetical protein [Archangium sp.]MDP3571923.1 hypothetical protein [Archangium sp.]
MWRSLRNNLPDVDKDELLEMIGLESRRSSAEKMVPTLALFGAGVLLGVGLGLMLAPKPGRELREDLKDRLGKGSNGAPEPRSSAPEARTTTA